MLLHLLPKERENNMAEEKKEAPKEENLKLQRINNLLIELNLYNSSLLSFDINLNQYNYTTKFNILTTLMSEVYHECTDEQKKGARVLRTLIFRQLNEHPPHKITQTAGFHSKPDIKLHEKNWLKVYEGLFEFETYIRELIDYYEGHFE